MKGKITQSMKFGVLAILLVAILANCNGGSGSNITGPNRDGETCCHRQINTTFTAPPDQSTNVLRGAWDSIFTTSSTGGGPLLEDCPLRAEMSVATEEYTFVGNLTAEGSKDVSYTVHVQLMDNANGAVVKEGSRSWRSMPLGTPQASADVDRNTKELAMTFVPLDDLLFAYEGLPQTASVSPEKDPLSSGEQMTIQVTVRASGDSAPQPWQWVVVEAAKGKILNGVPNGEGNGGVEWRRFRAENGTIMLQYQAPTACAPGSEDSETITLYNTCNVDEPDLSRCLPEDQIGRATFNIECLPFTGTFINQEQHENIMVLHRFDLVQKGTAVTGTYSWTMTATSTQGCTWDVSGTVNDNSGSLDTYNVKCSEPAMESSISSTIRSFDIALIRNGSTLRVTFNDGEQLDCIRQ